MNKDKKQEGRGKQMQEDERGGNWMTEEKEL